MTESRLISYDTADPQAGGQKRPFAKAVLALAGCGLEDVIKVTCWLDDPRDFSSFNAVFEKHFIDHPPARSTVQSRLMVDAKVEIDAIAWKPL